MKRADLIGPGHAGGGGVRDGHHHAAAAVGLGGLAGLQGAAAVSHRREFADGEAFIEGGLPQQMLQVPTNIQTFTISELRGRPAHIELMPALQKVARMSLPPVSRHI
jgi:hypothetical protein